MNRRKDDQGEVVGAGGGARRRPTGTARVALLAAAAAGAALALAHVAGAAPANDSFASAQLLSGWSGSTSGTTVAATIQNHEPYASSASRRTIWFSWTPSSSGPAE